MLQDDISIIFERCKTRGVLRGWRVSIEQRRIREIYDDGVIWLTLGEITAKKRWAHIEACGNKLGSSSRVASVDAKTRALMISARR